MSVEKTRSDHRDVPKADPPSMGRTDPQKQMSGYVTPLPLLGPRTEAERESIRQKFERGATARETLRALCELADRSILQVFGEIRRAHQRAVSPETAGEGNDQAATLGSPASGVCIVALGGYGRQLLFPYSDLDLLFLFANEKTETEFRPVISESSRILWDLGFRVSSAGRTLDECRRIEEDNAEFHLALLDRRFLAGDSGLFDKLNTKVLPAPEKHGRHFLLAELRKLTRERLGRYGNTIFHLEPNVKESPGALRDYQAAVWLRQISGEKGKNATAVEEELARQAVDFLAAIRCFLHYRNGRNDNTLTYELQAAAAERSLGVSEVSARSKASNPAEWMRLYFRHARTLNRQLLRYLEQRAPVRRTLRQRILSAARGQTLELTGNKPFAPRNHLFEVLDAVALSDRALMFSLFTEIARTGIPLSREGERKIGYILTHGELAPRNTEINWAALRELLISDYPGVALRPLQRLGLLTDILPEFAMIDSLVVRDFYHRYTVDEHTLRTIEHLQELDDPPDERGTRFSSLWKTAAHRELLVLALLLHDVGKGRPVENHVVGSLQELQKAAARLKLSSEERDEVHFLIEHHLDMSATVQRRDIFDPATVVAFAETVGTQERLQRLCLLTYADIHAVNPEALTPWKAEMLWQLFVATSNHLSRTVDRDRLHASQEASLLQQISGFTGGVSTQEVEHFLEGFPRRYLAVHSAGEIASHFALYRNLSASPVQSALIAGRHAYSLTLLTADRPALFETIAGVLARWGMNIIKAEGFANAAGVVLDTFHFTDLHRTLELNPTEADRFRQSMADVVNGKARLEPLLQSRENASRTRPSKVLVATQVTFDDASSVLSTLMEIVARDRPGLLYEIASILTKLECNIEVALVDTEGQKAIDVFYLTAKGKKLTTQKQEQLRAALHEVLT